METLIYLKIEPGRATPVDADGKKLTFNPGFQKNTAATLRFRLRDADGTSQYPAAYLANITSWYLVMANDWLPETAPQVKTTENISLEFDETNTDVVVSLTAAQTNTAELITALANASNVKLKTELGGLEPGDTAADFAKIFELAVYNRLESTEDPTELPETYWTIPEVKAHVATAPDFEFSIDGATLWHTPQVSADRYYRESRSGGEWSEAIELVVGPQGETGETPGFINGTFVPADLDVDGIIVITHNQGDITLPFRVTGPGGWTWYPYVQMYENTIVMDFCDELPLDAGTWEYTFGGLPGASGTGVAPRGTYAAGTNYALDDGATYDGSYYRSKIADNIGNQPDTSPTQWEEMISKGDTGANGTGVAPQGTYAAGTTYALNEGVVYDGSYYRSKIADNTGNQPDTSATQWEKMVAKGVDGINTLSLISADAYRTPLTGIPQPFSNTGNSANIMPDFDNYAGPRLLLSTSSNEPLKMYDYTVPDTTNIKRRIVFEPEKGTGWNGETVIWKSEHKKMTDNVAWTDKIAKDIGTFTAPNAITPTGDTTSGSAVITNISSTTGLAAGMLVTGTGIAANSAIVSIDSGTQITLSENATATGTTITLTCKSVAPQVYEVTTSLATLGFAAGDDIQEVIFVDSSSSFSAGDIAFDRCEITGV